jgi:uncharacterized membrane protein YheB (UPF0754 family)
MKSVFQILKIILLTGLPCVLLACMVIGRLYPGLAAVDWAFSIALAGLVGIGTNSLAIRMLFRPLRPTVFGRQGLIPRNKSALAASIATETEKRLLNIDIIMAHIEREKIVEQTIASMVTGAERYLAREENRRAVADAVLRLYNQYADRMFTWLTRSAEAWLIELARRPGTVERAWSAIKPRLRAFFESEELKHQTAAWILEHLVQRAPELADLLAQALDRYIAEQTAWKQVLLEGIRTLSGIKPAKIERMLLDFLHDPGTCDMVVGLVENNLENIESYFEQDHVRERVQLLQQWLEKSVLSATRSRAIPALRERIDAWLSSPEAWAEIDRYAQAVLKAVPPRVQQFLQRPENIKKFQAVIPGIIERLNIRRIVADNIEGQRTEDFEGMILRVAGENLAAIEVLGGLIGMLAGIALHRPVFLLVLPAAMLTLIGLERGLGTFRRGPQQ